MKKILNNILGIVGYEIRKKPKLQKNSAETITELDLREWFDKTEGMTSFEEASLLYRLAKQQKRNCIIEVGSYRGRSTVALGRGSMDGYQVPIFAIEPHEEFTGILGGEFGPPDRAAFYGAMLGTSCYQVVRLINLSSEAVSPLWKKRVGLLWIDADHSYEAVKRDYECWKPHLASDANIAFDDSVDPKIGPRQLINELIQQGELREIQQVGKVTVLQANS